MKILPGYESRDDRLPSRRRQRAARADEKGKQQQVPGSCQVQRDDGRVDRRDDRRRHLGDDEQLAFIDDVGKRAGRHCEQEHGQCGRDLNHGDDERLGIEARHQPAGGGVVHTAADVRDHGRSPEHRERRMPERAPW